MAGLPPAGSATSAAAAAAAEEVMEMQIANEDVIGGPGAIELAEASHSSRSMRRESIRAPASAADAQRTSRPPPAAPPDEEQGGQEGEQQEDEQEAPRRPPPPRSLAYRLYASHLLSTWNSRAFEFAAVLFLAAAFPGTLLPVSAYAVARGAAAVLLARAAGAWIDRGDRLAVVRASIVGQRAAVALSCGAFWALQGGGSGTSSGSAPLGGGSRARDGLFAAAVVLGCVEKLCSVMNLVSVERDWVVVITEGNEEARRVLNARMRRIDLFCKLVGPLVISFISTASTLVAIWATLATNVLSIAVEYFCIATVFHRVPELRRASPATPLPQHVQPRSRSARTKSLLHDVFPWSALPLYFRHAAFLPSFSLALLYLTVLSFSGQMVTYLVAVGYTPTYVGLARAGSTALELSATWAAPRLAARIGAVRGGMWSLCWQMAWLAAGVSWFFAGGAGGGTGGAGGGTDSVAAATGLAVGVALSRVGLWGFDLCAQNIVQDEVEPDQRGTFSTAEAAFQNLFDLLSYVSTLVFSRPDQFRWPVAISVAAVYAASGLYAVSVRRRRGHLFHPPAQQGKWLLEALERARPGAGKSSAEVAAREVRLADAGVGV